MIEALRNVFGFLAYDPPAAMPDTLKAWLIAGFLLLLLVVGPGLALLGYHSGPDSGWDGR